MKQRHFRITLLFSLYFLYAAYLPGAPLPRTVITLYDKKVYPDISFTKMHQYAEMPLNHLGVILEYHDLRQGLPSITEREDVIGVLVWFPDYSYIPDPEKYLKWAIDVVDSGKKFILMGEPEFSHGTPSVTLQRRNDFWARLGLHDEDNWVDDTYDVKLVENTPELLNFERPYLDLNTPYEKLTAIDQNVTVHLTARQYDDPSTDSALIATGPNGGYARRGYSIYEIQNDDEQFRKWYINPFEFFKIAFDLEGLPKPDTTTLAGRRIYYSHIDGDGWNSVTELEKYRREKALCAEVIFREIILLHPDLPTSAGPIAAEIDPDWMGNDKGLDIAKRIFAQPNVEVSCHTFTHPFFWSFFEEYSKKDEKPFLKNYSQQTWEERSFWNSIKRLWEKGESYAIHNDTKKIMDTLTFCLSEKNCDESVYVRLSVPEAYSTPRAYAVEPFNLDLEVRGAVEEINTTSPPGKSVALYQWSGNCQPFEEAIKLTKELKIRNINGGDTRFDDEFLSYSWVRPLGRQAGKYRQVYASCSNENTYTQLWKGKFYGFNQLPETLKNTETPIRIKPINIYHHMFSGEKLASLNALKQNLEYARSRKITPIAASRFAGIVDGFFTTQIIPLEARIWKIKDRGELQTIRFDKSALSFVDFSKSSGVVGERHFQGSLYVYLDESHPEPIIALKQSTKTLEKPIENTPYLIESRWRIWDLQKKNSNHLRFISQGYGKGEMKWKVPVNGTFTISWNGGSVVANSSNHELNFTIDHNAITPLEVTIERENES